AFNYFDIQGPNFSHEPPSSVEFTNNAGSNADCIAHGNPPPNVDWLHKDNNPITSISKLYINQRYEPQVQNPGGFIGSNVLIKWNIPSIVKEYVTMRKIICY
ncbi:uncharacterized protein LOC120781198, partial [Bactrocera tryoni]|uniref:uncharacterized protein LOC120781198 n=1 Tax=Bactrocera tryoni TaxID=59916 RepID=UPI001A973D76